MGEEKTYFTLSGRTFISFHEISTTVCPRSSNPIYIVSYHIKWVTTYCTYSICREFENHSTSQHIFGGNRDTQVRVGRGVERGEGRGRRERGVLNTFMEGGLRGANARTDGLSLHVTINQPSTIQLKTMVYSGPFSFNVLLNYS